MKILVLNCGSSSLKYKLFEMGVGAILAQGQADRIGLSDAIFRHEMSGAAFVNETPLNNHHEAVHVLLKELADGGRGIVKQMSDIGGVGHRVVHGGEHFRSSVVVNPEIRQKLESTKVLAPLHNPPSLMGIDVCTELMSGVPQVAVFDTAFHQTMPAYAYTYAIPYRYYLEDHVRRYGFHGISHEYVALRAAEILNKNMTDLRIVTCHLGAGSSLCAIAGGKALDTTMGFTPLSGLVMATRCGDMDPAVVSFIMEKEGCSRNDVLDILNRQSGVLGISGISPDFRDLEKAAATGNERAKLALEVYAYSVARGIGSLIPAIGGLDVLVFTAGIGENSSDMRARICGFLSWMDVELNEEMNARGAGEREISAPTSRIKVFVIKTDEEKMIARETWTVLRKSKDATEGQLHLPNHSTNKELEVIK